MNKITTVRIIGCRHDYDDPYSVFGCFLIRHFTTSGERIDYDDYILEHYTGVRPDLMMKMIVI